MKAMKFCISIEIRHQQVHLFATSDLFGSADAVASEELDAAIRARRIWEEIHRETPSLIFRGNGSLTLAKNEAELRVMEECLEKSDARLRKWEILGKKETQKLNPALRGNYIASLWCPLDGTVEPDSVLTSLRNQLQTNSRYIWRNFSRHN
jgi:glycine/D-amino acid oxidase-like deaminating enzyme